MCYFSDFVVKVWVWKWGTFCTNTPPHTQTHLVYFESLQSFKKRRQRQQTDCSAPGSVHLIAHISWCFPRPLDSDHICSWLIGGAFNQRNLLTLAGILTKHRWWRNERKLWFCCCSFFLSVSQTFHITSHIRGRATLIIKCWCGLVSPLLLGEQPQPPPLPLTDQWEEYPVRGIQYQ